MVLMELMVLAVVMVTAVGLTAVWLTAGGTGFRQNHQKPSGFLGGPINEWCFQFLWY
jgi:hypothetical protein